MTTKTNWRAAALAAAAAIGFAASAQSAPLSIVDVGAPAVNCVFNSACKVVVDDSVGTFTPPGDAGQGRLQSRTYPGTVPAPAAGDMAYVYRVDLTSVQGLTAVNCVRKVLVSFSPVVPLPYAPGALFDVYVVTSGGLGSVGLASANKVGNDITFTFAAPVCPGATSYFFGLASKINMPVMTKAVLFYSLGGNATTEARTP